MTAYVTSYYVLPCLSANDGARSRLAQPEKATNLLLRHLASKRANLSNLIWRNLRSAVTAPFKAAVVSVAKANAIGMAMILAARDPLQIPRNVVGFVSVDVVDLVGRRWRSEEHTSE